MTLEEALARAVRDHVEATAAPVLDPAEIRRQARRRRQERAGIAAAGAVALLVLVGLVGLTGLLGTWPAEPDPAQREPHTLPAELDQQPDGDEVFPGRYLVRFAGTGDGRSAVSATLEVPAGFGHQEGWWLAGSDARDQRTLGLWSVAQVNAEPCRGRRFVDPGPGVADLAAALAGQPVFGGGRAEPVTLGGHHGLYLEQTLPATLRPTSCTTYVDARAGDVWFYRWRTAGGEESWAYRPGDTHRLWILDVGGTRVVVDAGHGPDDSPRDVRELTAMVESLRFLPRAP